MDLKKSFYVGLDVGNYSTKTSNTTTTSGYKQYAEKPYGAANILKYDGVYYVPTLKPLSYLKDKTSNDRCLILSLLGIAQEILLAAKNEKDVQAAITDVTDLYLGVGLPPAHMSSLSENLENYYIIALLFPFIYDYLNMICMGLNYCRKSPFLILLQ